jgi:hypothetical protein
MSVTMLVHLKNGPLNAKATTQRTNFPFNSFCKFNGEYLAAGTTGLFELGGDTDNTVEIDAYFIPVKTDFGSIASKRMWYVRMTGDFEEGMYINVIADEETEVEYEITSVKAGLQHITKKLGQSAKGVFWSFEFGNVDGADFSFNRIDVCPAFLTYGSKN